MNCAPFLELNERLKTDVTVERMCPYKGPAQGILEYESKQQTTCSATLLTSHIQQRQKSTCQKNEKNILPEILSG